MGYSSVAEVLVAKRQMSEKHLKKIYKRRISEKASRNEHKKNKKGDGQLPCKLANMWLTTKAHTSIFFPFSPFFSFFSFCVKLHSAMTCYPGKKHIFLTANLTLRILIYQCCIRSMDGVLFLL